jgi:hypothetical protein
MPEFSLHFSDSKFANVEWTLGGVVTIQQIGKLNANEHAALACAVEIAKSLSIGKKIDRYFNPTDSDTDHSTVVKCKWMKSGRLSLESSSVDKTFHHATNVEQAVSRKRVFTCTMALYKILPKWRQKNV